MTDADATDATPSDESGAPKGADLLPIDAHAARVTYPVRVRLETHDARVIEGLAHLRAEVGSRRISDVLNDDGNRFLPLTNATYRAADGATRTTDCLLVHVEDIRLVDCHPPRPGDDSYPEPSLRETSGVIDVDRDA